MTQAVQSDGKTTIEMVNGLSEIADFMNDEELTTNSKARHPATGSKPRDS
jgi:hypothetical protein